MSRPGEEPTQRAEPVPDGVSVQRATPGGGALGQPALVGLDVAPPEISADATTVKLYHRGQLLKVHPLQEPGRRHTDPADLPDEVSAYALRDLEGLARRAAGYGPHIGAYAEAILEHPLPWTKMRQVYRLLGLARRHGAEQTDLACAKALEVEVVNVGLIERILARGLDTSGLESMAPARSTAHRPAGAATGADAAVVPVGLRARHAQLA